MTRGSRERKRFAVVVPVGGPSQPVPDQQRLGDASDAGEVSSAVVAVARSDHLA